MRANLPSLRRNRKAASPAVSMVIITAATIVLVLVSGNYALQVIDRQRASSEFETVTQSILAFDDAVRDIAWDRDGSRSVRFTTNYGIMQLLPGTKLISITGPGGFSQSLESAVVKYHMPTSQFTLGSGNSFYILGNGSAGVFSIAESMGQALASQESGFATISLNYRVRVAREAPTTADINYVDILVIRLICDSLSIGSGDFDLVAKNVGLETKTYGPYLADSNGAIVINSDTDHTFKLGSGTYMFNLITADVRVSP